MASFTPTVNPNSAPNYGSDSRPVDINQGIRPQGVQTNTIMPQGPQQGDTSAAYAGEAAAAGIKADAAGDQGIADVFKDIVSTTDLLSKAGVQLVKKDIEDKVYDVADRERQAYTDTLEKIKQGIGVKNVLDASPDAGDGTDKTVPPDVASLPDTLSALQGAKDAGKISGSYYQSRLLAAAKSLRAQYPGFREEIDQAFTKVTGSNPANAYVTSLVQDINRAQTSAASEKNKVLSFIQSNMQYPGAQDMFAKYNAGLVSRDDVFNWAAPYAQQDYNLKVKNQKFTDAKNTREDSTRIAGDNIDYAAGTVVNRAVDAITQKMGIFKPEDVDKLSAMQNGGQISPKLWQSYGQQVANIRQGLFQKMVADADAHGYTQAAGGKAAVIQRINDSLKPIDTLLDRIYNKDFGGIYDVQKQLQANNDITKQGLLSDPKLGPYFQTVQAVKDIGGEQNLQQFNLNTIKGDFNQNFQEYFKRFSANMASQYTMQQSGVPYTFNDVIDNLKANKVSDAKFNSAVLKEVSKIYDPNTPEPIKENYALAAFSPGNRGMISRLQADGYDAKGKPIGGQSAVYQNWTSPQMTQAMYDLGKKNPKIWEQYVDWAKGSFANELVPNELQNLGKISADSGVNVGWDSANHRFTTADLSNVSGAPTTRASLSGATNNRAEYQLATSSVNRINAELYNLKHIAERTGEDPDAFLIKTIADNAGPEVLRNVNSIPYQILKSIGLSKLGASMQNGRQ